MEAPPGRIALFAKKGRKEKVKIAIIYNRDSQAVINLFGTPNREKYGLQTIDMIKSALEDGGHQVQAFEGDKNIIHALEEFMPTVISGERPGLVFNLSYGTQGRARYTHIPGILEMLGIPYIGSGPETHAVALDKVLTKMVLLQKGLPTPRFTVLDKPGFTLPLADNLSYPLIVKPKDEAVSFGLRIVNNEEELREGVNKIYNMFKAPTLVEEYIEGREVNVGLLGNDPVEALPPVEIVFGEGEQIFTYEDKINASGRELGKICPAPLDPALNERIKELAVDAFKALGCFDSARVDFRLDKEGNPYILEVNSMASLGPGGSYVYAAERVGLDYGGLVNRLIEIASQRYFGPITLEEGLLADEDNPKMTAFTYLTRRRDRIEEELKGWTNLPSWTGDPVGLGAVIKRLESQFSGLGLNQVKEYTSKRSAWTWETGAGFEGGTLLVASIDVPRDGGGGYPIPFRRDPEWLYGEGIASSRAGITCILQVLNTLQSIEQLHNRKLGVFIYGDEGRGMRYSASYLHRAAQKVGRVIILQPGFRVGRVVDQRRGSRKYSILVEGAHQRIGSHSAQNDLMSWFLDRAGRIGALSLTEERLTAAVQEIQSERYSVLLPHRIRATVYVTFLDPSLADEAEKALNDLFAIGPEDGDETKVFIERLEERPPLIRSEAGEAMIEQFGRISQEWNLPFGVEAGLLPSAAGEVAPGVPAVCGFGPASQNMFTPHECIHRGELLQRILLLTLYLLEG